MVDEPDSFILVYLRRLDQRLERIETVLGEHGRRLTRIEEGLARVRRNIAD